MVFEVFETFFFVNFLTENLLIWTYSRSQFKYIKYNIEIVKNKWIKTFAPNPTDLVDPLTWWLVTNLICQFITY